VSGTGLFCVLQSTQFISRVINRLWMMLYNSDVVIVIITIDNAGVEFLHYIIVYATIKMNREKR